MSSVITDAIAKYFPIAERYFDNQTFIFNGETYPCIPSDLNKGNVVILGGLSAQSDSVVSLTVRREVFTDGIIPTPKKDHITFRSVEYRVDEVNPDPTNVLLIITLQKLNRIKG